VVTSRPFKPHNAVGSAMPGLANVHTRVFLAFGPESARAAALSRPIEKRTEHTVTDPAALAEELAKIRREGMAFGLQEWNVGMCAVAAPVFDSAGEVRACIAVVAPTERFGPAEMKSYARALKETAAALSRELGHRKSGGG
jgi:DNA-binding IclR family transcriptional regulator